MILATVAIAALSVIGAQVGLIFYLVRRLMSGQGVTQAIYDENFSLRQQITQFKIAVTERDRVIETIQTRADKNRLGQEIVEQQRDELLARIPHDDARDIAQRMRSELSALQRLHDARAAAPIADHSPNPVHEPAPAPSLDDVAKSKP